MRWQPGDAIVRREIWRGRPTGAGGGYVLEDTDEQIVLYLPEGAPLAFTQDFFGAPHTRGAGATAGSATAPSSSIAPDR